VNWLRDHATNPRESVSRFTTGGFVFAIGIMVIVLADNLMPDSVKQEVVALFGLIAAVGGALYSLWGYLGISLFKIILYILDTDESNK
jgi:hypothetical protein